MRLNLSQKLAVGGALCALVAACDRRESGVNKQTPAGRAADESATNQPDPRAQPDMGEGRAAKPDLARGDYAGTPGGEPRKAEVDLESVKPASLDGKVTFEQVTDAVRVSVDVDEAPPGAKSVVIEDASRCNFAGGDGKSGAGAKAGTALEDTQGTRGTGAAGSGERRELGKIEIDKEGEGTLEITVPGTSLKRDDPKSIVGKAIVIRGGDAQAARSGAPLACAVIKA